MIHDTHIEQNMVIKQKMMIKKFAKLFFIINFAVIIFCVLSNNYIWLLNTQVAFISSLIISIATFLSYKRNVSKRLENIDYDASLNNNDRDKIDDIEDPYDLYSENEINEQTEFTAEEIKEIIKDEKSKIKQNSLKNTFLSAPSFISLYRIAGYLILVVGFFILNNNELFQAIPYLIGLFIVPLSTLCLKFISK